jgi:hypothetical protein
MFTNKEATMREATKQVTFTVRIPIQVNACCCDFCEPSHTPSFNLEIEVTAELYAAWSRKEIKALEVNGVDGRLVSATSCIDEDHMDIVSG